MGSSYWGLDVCSGLAAAAGILLLLCLRDLSAAYPCRIEAPCVCSSAYPHLTSGPCVEGKWEREKKVPLPFLWPQEIDCPAVRLLLQLGDHHFLSPGMGLHPRTTFLAKSCQPLWFVKPQTLPISSSLSLSKVSVAQCLFLKGGMFSQALYFFSPSWCSEER